MVCSVHSTETVSISSKKISKNSKFSVKMTYRNMTYALVHWPELQNILVPFMLTAQSFPLKKSDGKKVVYRVQQRMCVCRTVNKFCIVYRKINKKKPLINPRIISL